MELATLVVHIVLILFLIRSALENTIQLLIKHRLWQGMRLALLLWLVRRPHDLYGGYHLLRVVFNPKLLNQPVHVSISEHLLKFKEDNKHASMISAKVLYAHFAALSNEELVFLTGLFEGYFDGYKKAVGGWSTVLEGHPCVNCYELYKALDRIQRDLEKPIVSSQRLQQSVNRILDDRLSKGVPRLIPVDIFRSIPRAAIVFKITVDDNETVLDCTDEVMREVMK